MTTRPIAYTYEADMHCPDCTLKRFGSSHYMGDEYIALTENGAAMRDNEGNDVHAVFVWSEYHMEYCGTCHERIE